MSRLLLVTVGVLAMSVQLLVPIGAQAGRDWFAAPDGSPSNDGSRTKPWDLATALDGRQVKGGDTVWLRGGSYRGPFRSQLAGTRNAPVTVRPAAGERAIISDSRGRADGGTLDVRGAWTVYRDFEVTNTSTDRAHGRSFRPTGITIQAPQTKFINLTIHNTGMGFGFWRESLDAELYGNVIFHSGTENTESDSRHGHGIYTQNDSGTKLIRDNIIVNQYGLGISAYPNPGGLVGFRFEGNVIAESGSANPQSGPSRYNNVLVSGYRPYSSDRIELIENFTYSAPREKLTGRFVDANLCLGCSDSNTNAGVIVRDNYFAGGAPVAIVAGWQKVTMRGNTFIGTNAMATVTSANAAALRSWDWDANTYIGHGPAIRPDVLFGLNGKPLAFPDWVTTTGFDKSSTHRPGPPTGLRLSVRPNAYEPGRAHVIVYNWDLADAATVELSSVLQRGSRYEIRSAMDFLGDPVASGLFDGRAVNLPLKGLRVAQPAGAKATSLASRGEFAVFVVRTLDDNERTGTPSSPPDSGRNQDSITSQALRLYSGTYVSRTPPAQFVITFEGDGLKAKLLHEPGQPTIPLVPVSSTRFQFEGAPGFFAVFAVDRGVVRSMTVERPNAAAVILVPRRD